MWSCKITWQTETVTSLLPHCLWPLNLAGWWLTLSGFCPWSYSTLWSRGLLRLHDQLKTCSLPQCLLPTNVSGWWLTFRSSYPCYSRLWSHSLVGSLDKLKTSPLTRCLSPSNLAGVWSHPLSHMILESWSSEIMWQSKTIISPLPQSLWHQNFARWWPTMNGFYP